MRQLVYIWFAGAVLCAAYSGSIHKDFTTSAERLERSLVVSALWPLLIAYVATAPADPSRHEGTTR